MRVLSNKSKGFTIIEAAVIILMLSICLIPVIRMVSSNDGEGNTASRQQRYLSTEQSIANSIMEKAVAGDTTDIIHPVIDGTTKNILSFNTAGNFVQLDSDGNFTSDAPNAAGSGVPGNRTFTYNKVQYKTTGYYYQWVVEDANMQDLDANVNDSVTDYQGILPEGNTLNRVLLRIYTGEDAATRDPDSPDYSLSTYFFKNNGKVAASADDFDDTIGVVLAVDFSLSMRMSNVLGHGGLDLDFFTNSGALPDISTPEVIYAAMVGHDGATAKKLPMRMSSGLQGYDPAAVASPYLVYRVDSSNNPLDDIFFSSFKDNTVTPYDERYNPCVDSGSDGTVIIPYASTLDVNDPASPFFPYINGASACGSAMAPTLPTTAYAAKVHVPIPTTPVAAIQAVFTGAGISTADAYGTDACLNPDNLSQATTCNFYVADDASIYSLMGNGANSVMLTPTYTKRLAANLFAKADAIDVTETVLSRIEAARTAMLAFVKTIENDSELVDNFRIGFVPFSTEVMDGAYSAAVDNLLTTIGPNEVIALQSASSGEFATLKNSFRRINRACNFTGYSYGASVPACPGGTQPMTLTGSTNLAHALYYSKKLFDDYESTNDPLDSKMIILLTDGSPTKSATAVDAVDDISFTEYDDLRDLSNNDLEANDISVYAVGLLTAGDPFAGQCLDGIVQDNPENVREDVTSVADLTPIFENIANQAEMLLLTSMKDRYKIPGM